MNARSAYVVPGAFIAASVTVRLLLLQAPDGIHEALNQPLPVATAWGDFGRLLWLAMFGCVALATISYLAILQGILCGKLRSLRLRFLIGTACIALTAALCSPVIFSSDVYAYAAYGQLAAHGISPYSHAFVSLHDPLMRSAIWQWSNPLPICVYGPIFVWIAKWSVSLASGFGPAAQLLALRIISSSALLGCGALIFFALHDFGLEFRRAAAAGILLNPVAIWSAAEGHNDAIMLLVVLVGFVALRKFGYFVGAFVIATSALIKASGAAVAIVLALFAWHDRKRFVSITCGFVAGIILTALVAWPFESGVRTVLVPHGHYAPQFSAQYIIAQITGMVLGNHIHALEFGIAIAVVATSASILHGTRLVLNRDVAGAGYIALGLWFLIPNPYPWYALWILPVGFLCIRSAVGWAIIAESIAIFFRYLPDVSSAGNSDINLLIATVIVGIPLVTLGLSAWRAPQTGILEGGPDL